VIVEVVGDRCRQVRRREGGHHEGARRRCTCPGAHAGQPVRHQRAEAVAEECVGTVECRPQLLFDVVDELIQRGESLAVVDLHRDHVDRRAERLVPAVEHRPGATGVMKTEQPHRDTRPQEAFVRNASSSASALTV
jgi:hypothetical protein